MEPTPQTARHRNLLRPAVRFGLSLALVIAIFFGVLPELADFSDVWQTIVDMTWLETITLLGLALWNLMSYWLVLVVTVPDLGWKQAAIVTQASTAVSNTLPGGPAIGLGVAYRMYASWNYPRSTIALALVVTGLGDLFAKLALPAFALVWLALEGRADRALVLASAAGLLLVGVGAAAFGLGLRSDAAARRIGGRARSLGTPLLGLVGRTPGPWDEALASFREQTRTALKGRWGRVLASALVSQVSLFAVLLIALRHVGVSEAEVSTAEALGAFAFVRLLSAVPITPGGLGIVELGLSAALVVSGGEQAQVVAAVLVFRALTFALQIPLGALAYVYWSHSRAGQAAQRGRAPVS